MSVTIEYERPISPQRSLPSYARYSSLLASVRFGTSSFVQRLVTISSNVTRNWPRDHTRSLATSLNHFGLRIKHSFYGIYGELVRE